VFYSKFYLVRFLFIKRGTFVAKEKAKIRIIFLPFAIVFWGLGWFLSSVGEKKSKKESVSFSHFSREH
jgi:hypothetical protein